MITDYVSIVYRATQCTTPWKIKLVSN